MTTLIFLLALWAVSLLMVLGILYRHRQEEKRTFRRRRAIRRV